MSRARAAVDCGTNTVRLLVVDAGGRVLAREERIVRLGQGVDATGGFAPEALARTFAALDEYAALADRLGARFVRFGATSAARDVRDVSELVDGVRARLGVPAEVLSGDEEARLTFAGALTGARVAGPVLVTDIGGGSTEVVLGDADGTPTRARSLDVGAVRLRERFLPSDPPTAGEVAAARAYVDGLLEDRDLGLDGAGGGPATWIGVAGTFTTLAALALRLPAYDPAAVDGTSIGADDLRRLAERCLRTPVADLVGPVVARARAEVIAGGAVVLAALTDRLGERSVLVREADLLDGLVRTADAPAPDGLGTG